METATKEFAQAHTFLDNGMKTPLLCTATDPEVKRKIIGDTFVTIAEKVSHIINKLNRMSVCVKLKTKTDLQIWLSITVKLGMGLGVF